MKKSKKATGPFIDWLDEKGLHTESFAKLAGLSVNTVSKWRYGTKPSEFVSATLGKKFPDCPIFK